VFLFEALKLRGVRVHGVVSRPDLLMVLAVFQFSETNFQGSSEQKQNKPTNQTNRNNSVCKPSKRFSTEVR